MPASAVIKDVCHHVQFQLVKKKLNFVLPCPPLILIVLFHYLCVCLCVGMSLCAPHVCNTCGGQKGAPGSLKLEF